MKWKVLEIESEPITIADACVHVHYDYGEQSELMYIQGLISSAREYAENVTGKQFALKKILSVSDKFEKSFSLPAFPVSVIESVKYRTQDGTVITMPDDNYYLNFEHTDLILREIPEVVLDDTDPVEIKYVSGSAEIPATAREAMLLLIDHWYNNRSAVEINQALHGGEVDIAARRLLNQNKGWWF